MFYERYFVSFRSEIFVIIPTIIYIQNQWRHESQEETERNEEYSIFTYRLRPSYDFIQELLWNGGDVEVLEPEWLRKEIAGKIKRIWNKYKYNTTKDHGERDN